MISLVGKELREHFKWALLAMVVIAAGEVHALYYSEYGGPDFNHIDGISICRTGFLLVTTFGCPLAGILLGLIQILPEQNRDRWAALLHRPVSRGTIFCGKAVAGLLLYALATVLPFLLSVWIAATPGYLNVPFVPELMLPGTADICIGGVYYFAALLLALQGGGWIGLRAFPLLAAVHVSWFARDTKIFYVAVEAAILMASALCVAAWGAMYHPRDISARSWLTRAAFLGIVFYGACGLGDLGLAFLSVASPVGDGKVVRYESTRDGIPMRLTYVNDTVTSVLGPDGKPPSDPQYRPDRIRSSLGYLNMFSRYIGDSHGWHPWSYPYSYRESQKYLWVYNPTYFPSLQQWFYLREQRLLIGYDPASKRPVGLFDHGGFEPVSATPKPLPRDYGLDEAGGDFFVWSNTMNARIIHFVRREIIPLSFPAPPPIFGSGFASSYSDGESKVIAGFTLRSGLAVYDDRGRLLTLLPYDHDTDRWGQIQLGLSKVPDRYYIWYQPSAWIGHAISRTMPSYFETVDGHGNVLSSYILPSLPDDVRPLSWKDYFNRRLQAPAFFAGTMIYQKIGAEFGIGRLRGALAWQFGSGWKITKEIALWTTSLSLLLAIAAFVLSRRAHFSRGRSWAWAGFVFGLNLAGFLTFLLAARWPDLVPCFSCRRTRPTEALSCPHCGADWPAPEPTGIEILEPAAGAVPASR